MNTLLAVALMTITLATMAGLIVLIHRDRPASPPSDQSDWRTERLAWRHVGIS